MAAVGDYESVLPFQAVGVDPYFLGEDASDVELLLRRLSREYAVVFLVESCFEDHRNLIDDLNDEFSVSIIPIQSNRGPGCGGGEHPKQRGAGRGHGYFFRGVLKAPWRILKDLSQEEDVGTPGTGCCAPDGGDR